MCLLGALMSIFVIVWEPEWRLIMELRYMFCHVERIKLQRHFLVKAFIVFSRIPFLLQGIKFILWAFVYCQEVTCSCFSHQHKNMWTLQARRYKIRENSHWKFFVCNWKFSASSSGTCRTTKRNGYYNFIAGFCMFFIKFFFMVVAIFYRFNKYEASWKFNVENVFEIYWLLISFCLEINFLQVNNVSIKWSSSISIAVFIENDLFFLSKS